MEDKMPIKNCNVDWYINLEHSICELNYIDKMINQHTPDNEKVK